MSLVTTIHEHEELIEKGKQELATVTKALNAAEKERNSNEKLMSKNTPKLLELRDCIKSLEKRMEVLTAKRHSLEEDDLNRSREILQLQGVMSTIQKEEADMDQQLQSSSSGEGLLLSPARLEEYLRLREEVAGKTAAERAEQLLIEGNIAAISILVIL